MTYLDTIRKACEMLSQIIEKREDPDYRISTKEIFDVYSVLVEKRDEASNRKINRMIKKIKNHEELQG